VVYLVVLVAVQVLKQGLVVLQSLDKVLMVVMVTVMKQVLLDVAVVVAVVLVQLV
jgi:hypothetical protein